MPCMIGKICSKCGINQQLSNRSICKECDRLRSQAKRQNSRYGGTCSRCNAHVNEMKNVFKLCRSCLNERSTELKNATKYKRAKSAEYSVMHIRIAEILLDRDLQKDDSVVHHVNERKDDNDPQNLIVTTRRGHSQLHAFLKNIREQFKDDNKYENKRKELTERFLTLHMIPSIWLGIVFDFCSVDKKNLILNLISEVENFKKDNP